MLVEGIGLKPPAPIEIPLSYAELLMLRNAAAERAAYRGYANRADAWGRGFISDPILVGLVGEHATCKLLSSRGFPCRVDLALRPHGDGGRDICVGGFAVQVKARRKGIAHSSLVKRGDRGHILPFRCDAFVFTQWNNRTPAIAPLLLGWILATDVRRALFERSPIAAATHWNLTIDDTALLPMSRLIADLEARVRA